VSRVVVIGAGPSGMMAAGTAASFGANVTILEKNEKPGRKLNITGKGRCNVTNNTDIQGLLKNVLSNPRFLNSAFYTFDSYLTMDFFETHGVELKTERGSRVFPVSEKASDITNALVKYMNEMGVKTKYKTNVISLRHENNIFIVNTIDETYEVDAVIIATGGLSYPGTGSTGDGYKFAKSFGHEITKTSPSLVALNVEESFVSELEGLSLKNVGCKTVINDYNTIYEETGEMMFTATGVTGPIILKTSATNKLDFTKNPKLYIDLKPALSFQQLDKRVLRDFDEHKNKNFANSLDGLLPQRMIEIIIRLSNISHDRKVNAITKEERHNFVNLLKSLPFTLTGNAGYKEAVVTKGGINVSEVNPKNLMSKKVPGLFFAGEVLDVDALTGGYNLQIAFSTGFLAGESSAKYV